MVEGPVPAVWVVAGCLFEVSLAEPGDPSWHWERADPRVTLLAHALRGTDRHFRFRAEAAGEIELRFVRDDVVRAVVVRIAREADIG